MIRPGMLGGHLMRRKGQSMEFRDYDNYQRGDDVRYVDWRASARYGQPEDLLVKNFVAEEQLRIFVSLDNRASMMFPEPISKMQYALWLGEALGVMTAPFGDHLTLHRLFGKSGSGLLEFGRSSSSLSRPVEKLFADLGEHQEEVNLRPLKKHLPPTAIWMIISDFYFEDDRNALMLSDAINRAQDGMRWIILVDIDSWPHEKAALGVGSRRIDGPGFVENKSEFDLDEDVYEDLEKAIQAHKERFLKRIKSGAYDLSTWAWPAVPEFNHQDHFSSRFLNEKLIQRIFMRDA
tara:strand:- start:2382 stop:3257 length:876 start_codon:yes stop_codon:yes gene_type:complete